MAANQKEAAVVKQGVDPKRAQSCRVAEGGEGSPSI